jgi:hypothetical protein
MPRDRTTNLRSQSTRLYYGYDNLCVESIFAVTQYTKNLWKYCIYCNPHSDTATTRFDCGVLFCGASAGEHLVSTPRQMGGDRTVLTWFRISAKCRLLPPPNCRHPTVPNPKRNICLLRTTTETIHPQIACNSITHWDRGIPKIHEYIRFRNCRHRTTNVSPRCRFRTLVTHLLNFCKYPKST